MNDRSAVTRNRIRVFVSEHFPGAAKLDDTESLLESGTIDSVGILDIVMFIEEEFAVTVSDEDLLADHFESIASLAALVDSKRDAENEESAA